MARTYPPTGSQPPSVELIVRQGPQPGQRFSLTKPTITIGREVGNDVVISDSQISRHHASLTWDGRHFIIQDLGSANGTFVNKERISEPHSLKDGDLLGLGGQVELAFRAAMPVPPDKMPTMTGVAAPTISGEPVPSPAPVPPPEPPGGELAEPPGGELAEPPGGELAEPPGREPAKPPGGEPAKPAPPKRRNVILISVAAFLGLCFILAVIGGLAYFFWPQEESGPIIIVATLTPTPLPGGPAQVSTPAATPPAQATVPPPTPGAVSAPGQPPPSGTLLWPIDAAMKTHLRQIMQVGQAKGRRINVFAKVGDSITESMAFLSDYCCGWYDLGPHTELEGVIQYFVAAHADELEAQANPYHTSFDRMSLAAESSAHAGYMLEGGADSNLMQEINAIQPGLAIVMFGTNEAMHGEEVATYKANLKQMVTILREEGVIPILSTIPDLVSPAEGGERIPAFNQVIKEVALEEQVPLMDFWQALQPLPNKGLDADGVHPNVFMVEDEYHSTDLTTEGLQYGYNVRNKLALEMLAKVKAIVIDDGPPDAGGPAAAAPPTEPPVVSPAEPPAASVPPTPAAASPSVSVDTGAPTQLVQPSDLVYQGAFRLPGGDTLPQTFAYGGNAMTFNPDGDPSNTDPYPGSLFVMGHDRKPYGELPDGSQVAEVSIPAPFAADNPDSLPTAEFLQGFHNVLAGHFSNMEEIPKIGMQYLSHPATGPKIHLAWGQHLQPPDAASHVWFNSTLEAPDVQGTWFIGHQDLYSVNGYMFDIPPAWADAHAQGRYLATGRMRDGGQGGMGPTLFAYRPWLPDGSAPPSGTHLDETTLLLYENAYNTSDFVRCLNGYQHADEWEGGAWITTPSGKSAVLFAGTKSTGAKHWYGFINPLGPEYPCVDEDSVPDFLTCRMADGSSCPPEDFAPCCDEEQGTCVTYRGWWSSRWDAQLILYDPADLARVAAGEIESWEPQPYASLDIDEHLYLDPPAWDLLVLGTGVQRRNRIGAAAYDRDSGHLYVLELYADGAKPVVHVWRVEG